MSHNLEPGTVSYYSDVVFSLIDQDGAYYRHLTKMGTDFFNSKTLLMNQCKYVQDRGKANVSSLQTKRK